MAKSFCFSGLFSVENFLMYTLLFTPWQFTNSSKSHSLLLFGGADYFYIFQLKVALTFSTAAGNLMSWCPMIAGLNVM